MEGATKASPLGRVIMASISRARRLSRLMTLRPANDMVPGHLSFNFIDFKVQDCARWRAGRPAEPGSERRGSEIVLREQIREGLCGPSGILFQKWPCK